MAPHLPHALRRHERVTLNSSYLGELGRGMFFPFCAEFALLVAVSQYDVDSWLLRWIISSATFFGMLAAVFITMALARYRRNIALLTLETVSRSLAIVAAFTTSGTAFVLVMAAGIAMNAVGTPMVSGIYGSNFRNVVRGRAVGRLHTVAVGMTAVSAAFMGWVMDSGEEYYRWLLVGVSAASLALSWFAYRRFPISPGVLAKGRSLSVFSDVIGILRTDRAFLYLQIYWLICGGSNIWLAPIRVLRLKETLAMPEWQVLVATTSVTYATMFFFVGFFGRFIYRMNFGLYRIVMGLFFAAGTIVFFHTTSFPLICFGSFLFALGLAGGTLSWRLVATFFTEPDRGPAYMCVHTLFCGFRGILGPMASLWLVERLSHTTLSWISVGGFLVSALMMVPFMAVIERRRHLTVDRPAVSGAGRGGEA